MIEGEAIRLRDARGDDVCLVCLEKAEDLGARVVEIRNRGLVCERCVVEMAALLRHTGV